MNERIRPLELILPALLWEIFSEVSYATEKPLFALNKTSKHKHTECITTNPAIQIVTES